MDRKGKGKQVAGNESYFGGQKRKSSVEFRDEGLRIKKRINPEVLQFFEESAEFGYYGGSSDEDDDGFGFLNVLLRCVTRYRIKSSEFSMAQERKSRRLSEEVVGNSSGAKLSRSEHSMTTSSEPNKSSYDFTVKDAKGNDVDISIYKGKSSLDCERCFSVWLDQFELYDKLHQTYFRKGKKLAVGEVGDVATVGEVGDVASLKSQTRDSR